MSGVHYTLQHGPDTFQVNVAVTGGMLVEPDAATGRVKPATAGSLKVLGVAANDANPAGTDTATNFANQRPHVAVYYAPVDIKVTYAAAAAFGDRLVAAANGQVAPVAAVSATPGTVDGNNTRAIIGICTEPAGVAAGQFRRMRLGV